MEFECPCTQTMNVWCYLLEIAIYLNQWGKVEQNQALFFYTDCSIGQHSVPIYPEINETFSCQTNIPKHWFSSESQIMAFCRFPDVQVNRIVDALVILSTNLRKCKVCKCFNVANELFMKKCIQRRRCKSSGYEAEETCIKANLHWGLARSSSARFFVCFIAPRTCRAELWTSAELPHATKQTKDYAWQLLARPQCCRSGLNFRLITIQCLQLTQPTERIRKGRSKSSDQLKCGVLMDTDAR